MIPDANASAPPIATRREYLQLLAANRKTDLLGLRRWLRETGLIPIRCDGPCDYPGCRGWRLATPEELGVEEEPWPRRR